MKSKQLNIRIEEVDKSWLELMRISPSKLFNDALEKEKKKEKKKS